MTDPIIDVHAHLVPRDLVDDLASGRERFPHIEVRRHEDSHVFAFNGGTPTRPLAPGLVDPAKRGEWLTAQGIDRQLASGWLDIFGYDLPADEGADWSARYTAALTEAVRSDDRLTALGTVPLQDPARAATALATIRAAGLPGIMIATRAGGRELDDPAFTPFWEAADSTGAIVFLHPGFGGTSARYHDFGLPNALARLEDSTVTLARLLYTGIPARYPGAKIVVAHAGGALPYALGRLARNHANNPDTTADPLESFARLYFDSVIFDPDALEFLVTKAGAARVLLGSDFPFPIGDLTPSDVVRTAELKDADRTAILGGNAARLLGEAGA